MLEALLEEVEMMAMKLLQKIGSDLVRLFLKAIVIGVGRVVVSVLQRLTKAVLHFDPQENIQGDDADDEKPPDGNIQPVNLSCISCVSTTPEA